MKFRGITIEGKMYFASEKQISEAGGSVEKAVQAVKAQKDALKAPPKVKKVKVEKIVNIETESETPDVDD